ncbi:MULTISPECIES: fatty acid desaturase [unclassified Paenibacillus]|uniref:fatty acid desaturase n=1 Tax=unclassified Paenibacillus TaxID=185978 RepID=UPI0009557933|nr:MULTISPECIES: fatty acid desaturase [unclassified Paenibacillus]ASS68700.1 fatty acid desaturase [Paenibacillus sp. RUD330]SIR56032.1 omega-6 fatty acid desaturase (delta-12 desaturase) [Paenibacillus sp. RU4X]SIR64559.1 omega-6 fatty acid desaturase (delta-12 desaturase) [Paenibacillus sp. RU4T]
MSPLKQLRQMIAPYEKSDSAASVWQLLNTLPPLALLWYAAYLSLNVSYALTLLFSVAAAGFVIRSFIIFHDCCHGSFFKSKRANNLLGYLLGVLTMFPYEQWKHAHNIHHAGSGNLEKRGIGDMWILTVQEYAEASRWRKLSYRIYRNPLVLFGLGPIVLILFAYRFNEKGARRKERLNTYATNAGIVVLYALLAWAAGWQSFLLVQLPIFWISGAAGIWLFYVQHQFEDSYFEHDPEWEYLKAAVDGSSYYKLPAWLQWLTGNIGFHHVHHLSPRIPNYRLQGAHEAAPSLQHATTITLRTSLKSLRFNLWDDVNRCFVSFRDGKRLIAQRPGGGFESKHQAELRPFPVARVAAAPVKARTGTSGE